MAKPNYAFEKRQRDLAKRQKKEEKRLKKLAGGPADGAPAEDEAVDDETGEGQAAGANEPSAASDSPSPAKAD
jgi:hypothetical protein